MDMPRSGARPATTRGGDAARSRCTVRPAHRQAAHSARLKTSGGGPIPVSRSRGWSSTPAGGSTPTSVTQPRRRRPPRVEAHDRANCEPLSPPVGVPALGNRVVERLVEADHIGQNPHSQRRTCASGRLRRSPGGRSLGLRSLDLVVLAGRCGLGGWLLEGELALRAGAQRPRADFRSARRSVLSQANSPSRAGRPKWP